MIPAPSASDDRRLTTERGTMDTVRFLEAVWGTGLHSVCWLTDGRMRWRFADSPAQAAPAPQQLPNRDLWFGAHPLRDEPPSHRRGDASFVIEVVAIPADLDWADPSRRTDKELPDEATVRAALRSLGSELAPSIIVNSGHGLQPWWLLDHAVEPVEGAELVARLSARLLELGIENGRQDLASILRLPGSTNWKDPERPMPVTVERFEPAWRFAPEFLRPRLVLPNGWTPSLGGGTRHQGGTSITDEQLDVQSFVMEHHGGHSPRGRGGVIYLWRPGKDNHADHSATIIVGDSGDAVLNVFSSNWATIGPNDGALCWSWVLRGGRLVRAHLADSMELDTLLNAGTALHARPQQLQLPGLESSWLPIDLGPVMAEGYEQPRPTVLMRSDASGYGCLFYEGAINGIHGDSGTGKGWVALSAIKTLIVNGDNAVLVDLEDTPGSIISRLRLLGVRDSTIEEHLVYIRPTAPPMLSDIAALVELIIARHIRLVVIDSLGEAFGLDGVNEDKDVEVAPWYRRNLRPLADAGAAIIVIDHATKAADNPLHPSGSKRKRAAITGASYLVSAVVPLVKMEGGVLDLICAKDRHGNYRRGEVVSRLIMSSNVVDVRVRFDVPGRDDAELPPGTDVRAPTEKAYDVIAEVLKGRQLGKRALRAVVMQVAGVGQGAADDAIDLAVGTGLVVVERGSNRSLVHRLADVESSGCD